MVNNNQKKLNIENLKAEWPLGHPYFFKQLKIGLLSHIFGPKKDEIVVEIKTFFKSHYNDPDPLVFDGNSGGFLSQLDEFCIDICANINNRIIDLGCGTGSLFNYLKKKKLTISSYAGIDFAIPKRKISKDAVIYNFDLKDPYSIFLLKQESIIFAVNTMCYFDKLSDIHILKAAGKEKNNFLYIVEPWPGIFWDRHFNGIWPAYRPPSLLVNELSKIGWKPIKLLKFHLLKILGIFLFPLSYAISFETI